jgi:hypothetical protein
VRFEKLQVLFGQLLFAAETTHLVGRCLALVSFSTFRLGKRPNNTGRRINLLLEEIDARVKPIISFHSLPAPLFTFTAAPPDLSLFFKKKKETTKSNFFKRKYWRVWWHSPSPGSGQRRAEPAVP